MEIREGEKSALMSRIKVADPQASSDEVNRSTLDEYGLVRMTKQIGERLSQAATMAR